MRSSPLGVILDPMSESWGPLDDDLEPSANAIHVLFVFYRCILQSNLSAKPSKACVSVFVHIIGTALTATLMNEGATRVSLNSRCRNQTRIRPARLPGCNRRYFSIRRFFVRLLSNAEEVKEDRSESAMVEHA